MIRPMPPSRSGVRNLLEELQRLRLIEVPLERAFWNVEKRIARLVDEFERRAG